MKKSTFLHLKQLLFNAQDNYQQAIFNHDEFLLIFSSGEINALLSVLYKEGYITIEKLKQLRKDYAPYFK